jgi:hypothetical protein
MRQQGEGRYANRKGLHATMWQAIAIVEGVLLLLIGLGIWAANRALDEGRGF